MTKSQSRDLASAAAILAMLGLIPVALRQLRVISHLPDPPFSRFDSDEITGSSSAFPSGIPDSLLGLGSYGVSLALLRGIGPETSDMQRTITKTKLAVDAAMALFNGGRQLVMFGKVCSWCSIPVLATAVMVPAGWASLRDR